MASFSSFLSFRYRFNTFDSKSVFSDWTHAKFCIRMERRFFLLSMTLLIVAIGLSVALTGVLYFGKTELLSETDYLNRVDQQSLRRLNRDEKSVDVVNSYQTSAAFVAQEPTLTNVEDVTSVAVATSENSTASVDDYCMTAGCINTAALILQGAMIQNFNLMFLHNYNRPKQQEQQHTYTTTSQHNNSTTIQLLNSTTTQKYNNNNNRKKQ